MRRAAERGRVQRRPDIVVGGPRLAPAMRSAMRKNIRFVNVELIRRR